MGTLDLVPAHLVVRLTLAAESEPLSPDAVSDLLAAVLDELDELGMSPSVASEGVGRAVDVVIDVDYELDPGETAMDGYSRGLSTVRTALHAAGLGTAGMAKPTNLASDFRQPELT